MSTSKTALGLLALSMLLTACDKGAWERAEKDAQTQLAADAAKRARVQADSVEAHKQQITGTWSKMLATMSECDKASDQVSKALGQYPRRVSRVDLYNVTARSQSVCQSALAELQELKAPSDLPKAPRKKLTAAMDICREAYHSKGTALALLLDAVNNNSLRPSDVTTIQMVQQQGATGTMACVARYADAASAVGVNIVQADHKP